MYGGREVGFARGRGGEGGEEGPGGDGAAGGDAFVDCARGGLELGGCVAVVVEEEMRAAGWGYRSVGEVEEGWFRESTHAAQGESGKIQYFCFIRALVVIARQRQSNKCPCHGYH